MNCRFGSLQALESYHDQNYEKETLSMPGVDVLDPRS